MPGFGETRSNTSILLNFESAKHSIWSEFNSILRINSAHPSVLQLAKWQMAAKFSRAIERMRSPRRLVLTTIAFLLALAWLGQAIAGVMLRQAAPGESLVRWIPMALVGYLLWNIVKTAGQKPVEPFEWTGAEREWLFGAPLKRADVILFRCSAITRAAFVKSLIFSLVMIPDLTIIPLGFLGILAALLIVDLIRILLEIIVYGLEARELMILRFFVFGAAAIGVGGALSNTVCSGNFSTSIDSPASFGFLLQLIRELIGLADTWYGAILLSPFAMIAEVVIADELQAITWLKLLTSGLIVLALSKLVPFVDKFFLRRRLLFEQEGFALAKKTQLESDNRNRIPIMAPPHMGGSGGLAWRQWLGAACYYRTLALSLAIPSLLCCMPAFSGVKDLSLVNNTVGALAFYSLLLLPASLKFDFRRDLDRLTVLKSLPVSPLSLTIGQLAMPVLLTTIFQLFTLLVVLAISPYNPLFIPFGLAVLLPFNVLVFSFENLTFLWYPHRINQEGLQVLLRSILAFTAKSLIFVLALTATYFWVLSARWIVENILPSGVIGTPTLFAAGMLLMISAVSTITFFLLVRAFESFDPGNDLVGLD